MAALVVMVAGGLLGLLQARGSAGLRPRTLRALQLNAIGLSGVPAAMFLANLVPWWRAPVPGLAVAGAVVLAAGAILAVAVLGSSLVPRGAGRVRAQVGLVAAITVLVFAADAFSGARLQIDSLLGYNPLVAGRFVGFGNIAFACSVRVP